MFQVIDVTHVFFLTENTNKSNNMFGVLTFFAYDHLIGLVRTFQKDILWKNLERRL